MSLFGTIRPGQSAGWTKKGNADLRVYQDPQKIFSLSKDTADFDYDGAAYVRPLDGNADNDSITAAFSSLAFTARFVGICIHDATNDRYAFAGHASQSSGFHQLVQLAYGEINVVPTKNTQAYFNNASPVIWLRVAWERVDASTFNVTLAASIDGVTWVDYISHNTNTVVDSVDNVGFFIMTSNTVAAPSAGTGLFYHFVETGAQ